MIFIIISTCLLICHGYQGESTESTTEVGEAPAVWTCPSDGEKSAAHRLRKDLMCGYDHKERPVKNVKNATIVHMELYPSFVTMNEYASDMSIHGHVFWRWTDEFLTWEPSQYEDIAEIKLKGSEFWSPDITVDEPSIVGSTEFAESGVVCLVQHTGQVDCWPPVKIRSHCSLDTSNFPNDAHKCTVEFRSWAYTGEHIVLLPFKKGVDLSLYKKDPEWQLLNVSIHRVIYTVVENYTQLPVIRCVFHLKRHSAMYNAVYLTPIAIVPFLSGVSFLLGPQLTPRLVVLSLVFFTDILLLPYTAYSIKINESTVPLLVCIYRDSLALTCFAICIAFIVHCLARQSLPLPGWLTGLIDKLNISFIKRLFFLEDSIPFVMSELGESTEEQAPSTASTAANKHWKMLARLVDRISFIILVIAYICLFIIYKWQ